MKIAIWHNLPSGGGKRAIFNYAKALKKRGHTLEAWCSPFADASYLPLSQLIPEHVKPCRPIGWGPARTSSLVDRLLAHRRYTLDKIAALDEHCRECATEINVGGFDVLLGNACMYLAVAPISRYTALPKAIYLQEPYRVFYEALPKLPWVAIAPGSRWSPGYLFAYLQDLIRVQGLRVQMREEQVNAGAYHKILVNSYFSRESILRAYGLDASVCYMGIDTSFFNERNLERENFVVGVGSITPTKNIRFVLEALSLLPEPRPTLVWAANMTSVDYQRELQIYAASVNVRFEPRIDLSEELVDLLNRATAMVYAPRLEPFGFAPLEANACGLPVIAVAEGGIRETVSHGVNGLLVDDGPQEMATAIQSLLENKSYARELGRTGAEIVRKKWTLEQATDRLEARLIETVALANRN